MWHPIERRRRSRINNSISETEKYKKIDSLSDSFWFISKCTLYSQMFQNSDRTHSERIHPKITFLFLSFSGRMHICVYRISACGFHYAAYSILLYCFRGYWPLCSSPSLGYFMDSNWRRKYAAKIHWSAIRFGSIDEGPWKRIWKILFHFNGESVHSIQLTPNKSTIITMNFQ